MILSALHGVFGVSVFVLAAWLLSEKRSLFSWRLPVIGIGLQVVLALLVFKIPFVQECLNFLNLGVEAVVAATEAGTSFVFGYIGADPSNAAYPFAVDNPGAALVLAFRILPLILVITVLSSILWYYRVLPLIINGFAYVLKNTLGVGGAVGFSAAANIFVGMVEAPTLIRPYFSRLTRSELFVVMSCGMATIAGTVLLFYATVLNGVLPNALGHILTASVMSAPAAIMFGLIMVPEASAGAVSNDDKGDKHDSDEADFDEGSVSYYSLMDAISQGTVNGTALMVNVGAMLLVLVALVALVNSALSLLPVVAGSAVTLEGVFGWFFAPVVWLMGVPWEESLDAGKLLGIKFAFNELLAFLALAELPAQTLSDKSVMIMSYAICGFANFGSLGIMIGGLTGLCPARTEEILELAPKSLVSGLLATCTTGAIAGVLY